MPLARRSLATLAIALLAAACSDSTSPKSGNLTVTVSAPTGVTPSVTVTGPGGFSQTLHASGTLHGLTSGSYTIAAATTVSSAPIVSVAYAGAVTGSPAVVSGGHGAAATVTYSARPGSGGLWLVGGTDSGNNALNAAVRYDATQLQASSSAPPTTQLQFPVSSGTQNIDASGAAFDHDGNLWVVNDNSNTVVEYTTSQLGASGAPTPAVTLDLGANAFSYALAFDAQGNLWVANNGAGTIVEFSPSQLAVSGAPTPVVSIVDGQPFTNEPIGMAFDVHGNLWIANNVANTVVEYAASQLTTSGAPTPAVTLSGTALDWPYAVAFDSTGNLWVSNLAYYSSPGRIVEYAASALTATGSPTPTVTLNLPAGTNTPVATGIAFDNSGNLWYEDAANQLIGEYSAAQLTTGGTLSPTVSIVSPTQAAGVGMAFDPHSAALPLH
jgi:sugar lactone lactonase YvrE